MSGYQEDPKYQPTSKSTVGGGMVRPASGKVGMGTVTKSTLEEKKTNIQPSSMGSRTQ
jgi:hypothetical protein